MYEKIAAMVPRNVFKAFNEELVYAGIDIDAKSFVGFVFVLGFAIAIAIGFGLQAFFVKPWFSRHLLPVFI